MSKNIGTLVTAAIRPNDSLDLIASAFANEIKGGLHSVTSSTDRDSIISERREWGMLCSVINDNKTYKLTYGYNSNVITDNLNWVDFQGNGGGSEWVDSVISILSNEPGSPTDGDRYLVGTSPTYSITGDNWSIDITGGSIAQWNSSGPSWVYTTPLKGMSVVVDNEYNSIYRYDGTYPTGTWYKEKQNQVRYISATSSNGRDYTAITFPSFSEYDREMIYIIKFDSPNTGTSSLSINGLPAVIIKKTSGLSLLDVMEDEITNNYQYITTYNGTNFELKDIFSGSGNLSNKYYIEPNETVIIPPYTQYLIYGDLDVDGTIDNYGKVTVINGNISASSSINLLDAEALIEEVSFAQIDGLGQSNYLPKWKVEPYNEYLTYHLTGTSSIYDNGDFISVSCTTFSIVNDFALPKGASQGYILTSDSNGSATWQKGVMKYTSTQSFVANFTYSVTHGLDSYSIIHNIWNEISGEPIIVSVKKTGLNTIDIMSTDNLSNVRIVIIS